MSAVCCESANHSLKLVLKAYANNEKDYDSTGNDAGY